MSSIIIAFLWGDSLRLVRLSVAFYQRRLDVKKSIRLSLLAITFLMSIEALVSAQSLQQVAPEKVGLSKARLDRIRPAMEKFISENRLAGGVGLIARQGKVAYFETYGMADKEAGKPMHKDSIFRIYSMTKAVTGVAAMILYEEGRFSLTDPISKYLPEFAHMKVAIERADQAGKPVLSHTVPAEREITVLDLMRHTSGLNYAGPHDEKGEMAYRSLGFVLGGSADYPLAELVKRLSQAPLVHQPGTIWDYGWSIDVLARLVEVVAGQPIDHFFSERIFKPLHMDDTGYYVPEGKWDRLVAMYQPAQDGTLRPAPAGMQESAKKNPALMMGGAGLMSTAMDYLRFVQMLLGGGQLDGVRLLGPKTVELMRSDLLGDLPRVGILQAGYGFGLTFAVNRGPAKTASIGSKGEYFWGGAAGTAFWIDPEEKLVGVFMMQTLGDLDKGSVFKRLTYQAIVDQEREPEK
jgi:CubicO group peptidase (beta-lactamase class C family)